MAVYSQYNVGGYNGGNAIIADESYIGAIGAFQMMEESSINTRTIFEHVLGVDFAEAQAANGYISESTFEAITEASAKGIFSKVIAFFKKLGEKIKGIIQNMIDKISAMFTKDAKALVKKFEKKINSNLNNSVYTDSFKYNWAKPKSDDFWSQFTATVDKSGNILNTELPGNHSLSGKDIHGVIKDAKELEKRGNKQQIDNDRITDDVLEKKLRDTQQTAEQNEKDKANVVSDDLISDYKDAILGSLLPNSGKTDVSSFANDFDEAVFDDSEQKENFDRTDCNNVKKFLTDYNKIISELRKSEKKTEDSIKKIVKEAEDIQKETDKKSSETRYGASYFVANSIASSAIKMGNACSSCSSTYFAAVGASVKKMYKQSRALWIKAGTYNKKSSKNEAALYEAYDEVSDYEVDQMMPEF